MNSVLFNIQKFSLHDGPGIRTVVFLKGCPLSCRWCSNPESQLRNIQILRNNMCTACGICVSACPQGGITFDNGPVFDYDKCSGCKSCIAACPNRALSAEGEAMDVEAVLRVCLQDEVFYEESGGGVTVSGGECLASPEFTSSLIDALHGKKIHVALETTGYAEEDIFREVALKADLLLFDVKHWESEKHKVFTGVGTELIHKNLRTAIENGVQVLPRIPVIPGFNAELSDAEKLAELLLSLGAKEAQLLPFHQFGESKYNSLRKEYAYTDIPALHEEDLTDYIEIFINKGIHAFF